MRHLDVEVVLGEPGDLVGGHGELISRVLQGLQGPRHVLSGTEHVQVPHVPLNRMLVDRLSEGRAFENHSRHAGPCEQVPDPVPLHAPERRHALELLQLGAQFGGGLRRQPVQDTVDLQRLQNQAGHPVVLGALEEGFAPPVDLARLRRGLQHVRRPVALAQRQKNAIRLRGPCESCRFQHRRSCTPAKAFRVYGRQRRGRFGARRAVRTQGEGCTVHARIGGVFGELGGTRRASRRKRHRGTPSWKRGGRGTAPAHRPVGTAPTRARRGSGVGREAAG